MRNYILLILFILLTACTEPRLAKLDVNTKTFKTEEQAIIVLNKKVNLDKFKSLILVSEDLFGYYDAFNKQTVQQIGYFENVVDFDELQTFIIQNDLVDKVPEVRDRLGLHNLSKAYKPFVWLRYQIRKSEDNKHHIQLILTDTLTAEDYFIAETVLDNFWVGVNARENWYPLFNGLIDYIKNNSETFGTN